MRNFVPPANQSKVESSNSLDEFFGSNSTVGAEVEKFRVGEVGIGIGQEEAFSTRKKGRRVNYKFIENPTYPKNIGADLRSGEDALSTIGQSTLVQFTVHKRRSQRAEITKKVGEPLGFNAQFANQAEANDVRRDIEKGNIQNLQELAALGIFPDDGNAFFAFEEAQNAARDPQEEAAQQAAANAKLNQTALGNPANLNVVDDIIAGGGTRIVAPPSRFGGLASGDPVTLPPTNASVAGLTDKQAQKFVERVSQDVRISRADDEVLEKIRMYIPSGLEFGDGVNFQDMSPGVFGELNEALAGNLGAGAEFLTLGAARALGGAVEGVAETLSSFLGAPGAERALQGGAELFIQGRLGVSANPRTEMAFNGVSRKSFSLGFNMAPRDEEEALHMLNIIEAFRFHMMPELSLGGSMLLAPHEFDIKFMMTTANKRGGDIDSLPHTLFIENPHIPKLGRCFLTGVNVNYAPNSRSSFFHDGVPTEVQLGLSFQQAFLSNRQFVLGGF